MSRHCSAELEELREEWGEEGRAAQLDLHERLLVFINDALHSGDLRVVNVAVKREAMVDFLNAAVVWYSSESKHWKAFVCVVRLKDLAYVLDGRLVLVVNTEEMEAVRTSLASV